MYSVILKGCDSILGWSPVTNIVSVSPRLTSIHPNRPPLPSESLVIYLYSELPGLISSDSTVIVTGDETQAAACVTLGVVVTVGEGVGSAPTLVVTLGVLVTVGEGVGSAPTLVVTLGVVVIVGVMLGVTEILEVILGVTEIVGVILDVTEIVGVILGVTEIVGVMLGVTGIVGVTLGVTSGNGSKSGSS